jgi:hypothetical protein
LIIREVFHLPLKSTSEIPNVHCLFASPFDSHPHYSQICWRSSDLGAKIKRLSRKRPTDLVFDSTGLKVYGEGEWKVRQHGKSKRRTRMSIVTKEENGKCFASVC